LSGYSGDGSPAVGCVEADLRRDGAAPLSVLVLSSGHEGTIA
jgi:hypothetical protein